MLTTLRFGTRGDLSPPLHWAILIELNDNDSIVIYDTLFLGLNLDDVINPPIGQQSMVESPGTTRRQDAHCRYVVKSMTRTNSKVGFEKIV